MNKIIKLTLCFLLIFPTIIWAQKNLPDEVKITEDGRLKYGGNPTEGFYDINTVHKLEITLVEPDWFRLLDGERGPRGTAGVSLIGTLTVNDDEVFDSVLISIKGQTSDFRNNSEKKSFKIEMDEIKDHKLMGYDNLNLNCAFDDHSSMREVLYYDITRGYVPALKGNFVDLYINGQYWGPYNNIQQVEGTYIQEWFGDNEGTRWRAIIPDDVTAPQGDPFGTGFASLNYNGPDSSDYNTYYTLKKTEKLDPWADLIDVTQVLNSTPIENLYDALVEIFDIDRCLWHLAQEVIFSDDDSYIFKGGMDYYVYWDNATGRMMPLEVDGNSVMVNSHVNWDLFYNENDARFPLMNRMLQNEEIRQRYLAHVRTIFNDHYDVASIHERIDEFAAILDQKIQDDPKKIYTYAQFISGIADLKDFITDRKAFLLSNNELNELGLEISDVEMESSNGVGMAPEADEEATIRARVETDARQVRLYYGQGFDGKFNRVDMFDDGMHNDGQADDGVYGGNIAGYGLGNYVRYYIEAIKNDNVGTASYFPAGAEHDVFIYQVQQAVVVSEDLVINEFMADNDAIVTDAEGKYEDWIELYNKGNSTIDLSGYFLSDDEGEITKWTFPSGTTLAADEYLIVWADDDEDQNSDQEIHSNFKLSKDGESIILSNADQQIIDQIDYPEQQSDVSYARIPNGVGDFQFRTETFAANNDGSTSSNDDPLGLNDILIFPNPSSGLLNVDLSSAFNKDVQIEIFTIIGQKAKVLDIKASQSITPIDISELPSGPYVLRLRQLETGELLGKKMIVLKK